MGKGRQVSEVVCGIWLEKRLRLESEGKGGREGDGGGKKERGE